MKPKQRSKFKEFIRELSTLKATSISELKSVYVFWGTSDYFVYKATQTFLETIKKGHIDDIINMEGSALTYEALETLLGQDSIFASPKGVVIRRFEQSKKSSQLLDGISIGAQTYLCINYSAKSLPQGLKQALKNFNAVTIECHEPSGYEVKPFIQQYATSKKLKMQDGCFDQLIQCYGNDSYLLINAVDQLSLIFNEINQPLRVDQIKPYLSINRQDHIFKLESYLLKGSISEAQILVLGLLNSGESPLSILAIYSNFLRKVLHVANKLQKGVPQSEVVKDLRIPNFIIPNYIGFTKMTSPKHLKSLFSRCHLLDCHLKSKNYGAEDRIFDLIASTIPRKLPSNAIKYPRR